MDMVKFITSVCALLLLGVFLPSDACKCNVVDHPQWYCCNSNAAVKAQFIEETQEELSRSSYKAESGYKIKTCQVLHGDLEPENVNCVVSALLGTDCEYKRPADAFNKDYVIAGNYTNGKMVVTACSCIKPWSELTPSQVMAAGGLYRTGCSCTIKTCNTAGCMPEGNTCILEEYDGGDSKNQKENQACLPEGYGCVWKDIL